MEIDCDHLRDVLIKSNYISNKMNGETKAEFDLLRNALRLALLNDLDSQRTIKKILEHKLTYADLEYSLDGSRLLCITDTSDIGPPVDSEGL